MAFTDLFGNLGGTASSLGAGVGGLFSFMGDEQAASLFSQAAGVAQNEEQLWQQATQIKETQAARQVTQTIGKGEAQVGAGGFAESGSALDILRSSRQQGSLIQQQLQTQGNIEVEGAQLQSLAYSADAANAQIAADTALVSGITGVIGGGLKLFGI